MPLTCADTALIHDDCFTGRMNQVDEMLNDIPLEPLPTSAETILSFIPSLSFLRGKHVLNRHAVTLSNKKNFKLQFSSFFFFFLYENIRIHGKQVEKLLFQLEKYILLPLQSFALSDDECFCFFNWCGVWQHLKKNVTLLSPSSKYL